MNIINKERPPSFYADLTWHITVEKNGNMYKVLIGDEDIDNIERVAERSIDMFEEKIKQRGRKVKCNLSLGIKNNV